MGQYLLAEHCYYSLYYKSSEQSLYEHLLISMRAEMVYAALLWPYDKLFPSGRLTVLGS